LASQSDNVRAGNGLLMGGTGDVQVNLTWNTPGDVDLHVVDPTGFELYYAAPSSPSGGRLDFDNTSGFGPENIFWPTGTAPSGQYLIRVVYYAGSVSPISFTIVATVNGVTQRFTGQLFAPGQVVNVAYVTLTRASATVAAAGGVIAPVATITTVAPQFTRVTGAHATLPSSDFAWLPKAR
jgi:hypothetical protein